MKRLRNSSIVCGLVVFMAVSDLVVKTMPGLNLASHQDRYMDDSAAGFRLIDTSQLEGTTCRILKTR